MKKATERLKVLEQLEQYREERMQKELEAYEMERQKEIEEIKAKEKEERQRVKYLEKQKEKLQDFQLSKKD